MGGWETEQGALFPTSFPLARQAPRSHAGARREGAAQSQAGGPCGTPFLEAEPHHVERPSMPELLSAEARKVGSHYLT